MEYKVKPGKDPWPSPAFPASFGRVSIKDGYLELRGWRTRPIVPRWVLLTFMMISTILPFTIIPFVFLCLYPYIDWLSLSSHPSFLATLFSPYRILGWWLCLSFVSIFLLLQAEVPYFPIRTKYLLADLRDIEVHDCLLTFLTPTGRVMLTLRTPEDISLIFSAFQQEIAEVTPRRFRDAYTTSGYRQFVSYPQKIVQVDGQYLRIIGESKDRSRQELRCWTRGEAHVTPGDFQVVVRTHDEKGYPYSLYFNLRSYRDTRALRKALRTPGMEFSAKLENYSHLLIEQRDFYGTVRVTAGQQEMKMRGQQLGSGIASKWYWLGVLIWWPIDAFVSLHFIDPEFPMRMFVVSLLPIMRYFLVVGCLSLLLKLRTRIRSFAWRDICEVTQLGRDIRLLVNNTKPENTVYQFHPATEEEAGEIVKAIHSNIARNQ